MLTGELERVDEELARLNKHRAKVDKAREACEKTLAYMAARYVDGLPTVRAHREYGKRGDLQQFLAERLRASAPAQFSTAELAMAAMAKFGLEMSCPKELLHFKSNTVGRVLRRLQAKGVVERLPNANRVNRAMGTWRWLNQGENALARLLDFAANTVGGR